jgi:hypothetical protein
MMEPPTQADFAAADAALPRAASAAMARVGLSPSMLAAVAERDDVTLLRALLEAGVQSAIERVQIVAWARRTQAAAAAAMQPPSQDAAAPAPEVIVKNPIKTFTFASFRASLALEKQRRREAALAEQMRLAESTAPPPAEAAAKAPQRPFKSALQSPGMWVICLGQSH